VFAKHAKFDSFELNVTLLVLQTVTDNAILTEPVSNVSLDSLELNATFLVLQTVTDNARSMVPAQFVKRVSGELPVTQDVIYLPTVVTSLSVHVCANKILFPKSVWDVNLELMIK
jgi:hypothetical protein